MKFDGPAIVREAMRGCTRPILAYSGGKDAIATAIVMLDEGLDFDCACDESFYFDFQRANIRAIAGKLGLKVRYYDRFSLEWLRARPQFLFMHDNSLRSRFFGLRQQRTVELYAGTAKADVVFFGRRLSDGNTVPANIYDRRGRRQAFPIRNWSEQAVWDILKSRGIRPAIYDTPYGRTEGNGPFNIYRAEKTNAGCWSQILATERSLVERCAGVGLPGAKEALCES